MLNQKDVFQKVPLNEIRAKARIKLSMEDYLREYKFKGGKAAKGSVKLSSVKDSVASLDANSSFDDLNWQVQFEKYTETSTPDRLLDHC